MIQRAVMVLSAAVLIFSFGCATSNNSKSLRDFSDHLEKSGVRVEAVQELFVNYGAAQAVVFYIAGEPIGVYKFDTNIKTSAEKLKVLKDKGYVYFNAEKYPVIFNGSFMVVRYESNKKKHEIIKAVETF